MGSLVNTIKEHHAHLRSELSQMISHVESEPTPSTGAALVRFLTGELLPHAQGEEDFLYPEVDLIVKAHDRPTLTMTLDHERIRAIVVELRGLTREMRRARGSRRAALERRLTRLAVQLEGILQLHLDKEEVAYLPLLDRELSEEKQQEVLEKIHEG